MGSFRTDGIISMPCKQEIRDLFLLGYGEFRSDTFGRIGVFSAEDDDHVAGPYPPAGIFFPFLIDGFLYGHVNDGKGGIFQPGLADQGIFDIKVMVVIEGYEHTLLRHLIPNRIGVSLFCPFLK